MRRGKAGAHSATDPSRELKLTGGKRFKQGHGRLEKTLALGSPWPQSCPFRNARVLYIRVLKESYEKGFLC